MGDPVVVFGRWPVLDGGDGRGLNVEVPGDPSVVGKLALPCRGVGGGGRGETVGDAADVRRANSYIKREETRS